MSMFKQMIVNCFIVVCLLVSIKVYAAAEQITNVQAEAALGLAILFHDTEFAAESPITEEQLARKGIEGAMTGDIINFVTQSIPLIASSSLLYNLNVLASQGICSAIYVLQEIKNDKEWIFVVNKTNDFVVLLPYKYIREIFPSTQGKSPQEILEFLGFNVNNCSDVGQFEGPGDCLLRDASHEDFGDEIFNNNSIIFEHFKQLFGADKGNLPKRIMLSGHGLGGSRVALLTMEQFYEFLDFLNDINADFIYISTCFAGGENLLSIHNYLTKETERLLKQARQEGKNSMGVRYAIVLGATADYPVRSSNLYVRENSLYKKFFKVLRKFMKNPLWYAKQTFGTAKGEVTTIHDVLRPLYKATATGGPTGYLSICYPKSHFFRVVGEINALHRSQIVTWSVLARAMLANKLLKGAKTPLVGMATDQYCDYMLFYPSYTMGVHLSFPGQFPTLISMIPGQALHIFDSVSAVNKGFDEVVRGGFCAPLDFGWKKVYGSFFGGLYNKAWFVKGLLCRNYKDSPFQSDCRLLLIRGLVFFKSIGTDKKTKFEILFKYKSNFYLAEANLDNMFIGFTEFNDDFKFKPINEQVYYTRVNEIKDACFPSDTALYESSGGNENRDTLDEAYNGFLSEVLGYVVE